MNSEDVPVFTLTEAPLAADGTPIWTPELETIANRTLSESGNWFAFLTREHEGMAFSCGYQKAVRKWNLRAVMISTNDGKQLASFQFLYLGESRDLPGGGQKMYWRLPVNERMIDLFATPRSAIEALFVQAEKMDELAEEVFMEASAGSRSFNRSLIDDLAAGRVPSADELASRMGNPSSAKPSFWYSLGRWLRG